MEIQQFFVSKQNQHSKQNKQPLIQNEWSSLQNKQCNKIVHNKQPLMYNKQCLMPIKWGKNKKKDAFSSYLHAQKINLK